MTKDTSDDGFVIDGPFTADKGETIVIDADREATDQTDDVVWINPFDAMSDAESPTGGDS